MWPICWPLWRAFSTLSANRPVTVGMGGAVYGTIPYTEKSQYAQDHGFTETAEDFQEFLYVVGRMDAVYLEYLRSKTPTSPHK